MSESIKERVSDSSALRDGVMFPGAEIKGAEQSLGSIMSTVGSSGIYPPRPPHPHMAAPTVEHVSVCLGFVTGHNACETYDSPPQTPLPRSNDMAKVRCSGLSPAELNCSRETRRVFSGGTRIHCREPNFLDLYSLPCIVPSRLL